MWPLMDYPDLSSDLIYQTVIISTTSPNTSERINPDGCWDYTL